ncbi:MAG: AAA family ATPase [Halieaceae bacterium]|jgi:DNA repair exonuclease SbcCD ATPase subunit|nr:AAA family ATPase [Halieaceae bacterium]
MKIRSIRVNQWANFSAPAGIEGLSNGLNVLVAPNESGKSSLVSALRHALFSKHKTQGGPLRPFINRGSEGAPVVEVGFEVNGEHYTVRKRFLRGKYARLRAQGSAIEKQAEPAEAALQELLGYDQTRQGIRDREALGMWPILLAEQGDTLSPLSFHPGAQATVLGALEETVGKVMGGEQGRALPALVKKELGSYLTVARGAPTGRYREVGEALETLRAELGELREREAGVAKDLEDYRRLQKELRELAADSVARDMSDDLRAAQEQLRQLAELEQRIGEAQTFRDREAQALEDIEQRLRERDALKQRREELNAAIARQTQVLSRADEEERRLKSLWDTARERYREASDRQRRASVENERARRRASRASLLERLEQANKRLQQLEQLEKEAGALRASLEGNPVTQEALAHIEELGRRVESSRARLSSAATLVDFDLEAGTQGQISVDDGQPVDSDVSLQVLSEAVIRIQGVGSITVRPQLDDADALVDALEAAEEALVAALGEVGAQDLATARSSAEQRSRRAADLHSVTLSLEALAPEDAGGTGQLRRDRDQLAASVAALGEARDDEPDAQSAEALSRASEACEQALREARLEAEAASMQRDGARDAYEAFRAESEAPRRELLELQSTGKSLTEQLEGMRPESELEQALGAAKESLAAAEDELAQRRAGLKGLSAAQLSAKVKRLENSLHVLGERKEKLTRDIASIEGRLSRDGGAGLGEQIASKERDIELMQVEFDHYREEAEVLTTLDAVLSRAEREARDRFMGPITQRVLPYLEVLFPDAEIEMDESLSVREIRRRGCAASDLSLLSKGTQEQINILVRIAIAELLAEQGRPSLLVLDDAMAFADDDRTEKMLDILTMAAEKMQILLLTCHEQTFRRAGGTRIEIIAYPESEEMATA